MLLRASKASGVLTKEAFVQAGLAGLGRTALKAPGAVGQAVSSLGGKAGAIGLKAPVTTSAAIGGGLALAKPSAVGGTRAAAAKSDALRRLQTPYGGKAQFRPLRRLYKLMPRGLFRR